MPCCAGDNDHQLRVIHRLWRAARAVCRLLLVDRRDGDWIIVGAGPFAARSDTITIVDEGGSKAAFASAESGVVSSTIDQQRRCAPAAGGCPVGIPTMWLAVGHNMDSA